MKFTRESRRRFLAHAALAAAGGVLPACRRNESPPRPAPPAPAAAESADDWEPVRRQFVLLPDYIHMSALYIASHPAPVREAIERYRQELDASPVLHLIEHNRRRINNVLSSAAAYLGVDQPDDIALTDSTTMGLGLVYNGLRLDAGDDVLTTKHDYYVTHESLRLAALHKGIRVRQVALYDRIDDASEEQITERLVRAIRPRTRVLALTWVHSGTGLKLPMRRIADAVGEINRKRIERERILICLDGVHGFGVEDASMGELGCDFFIAGCHKWLFGPRGTGVIWGSAPGWRRVLPTVPSFLDGDAWSAWFAGTKVTGRTDGQRMSPGGFKAFEHQWALADAFAFHMQTGKSRIAERTHALATQLKEGLAQMPHIALRTPRAERLSAGIVCFEVDGMSPYTAVTRLRERGVIATVTPYAARYVRLGPSIRNTPAEVETALREIRALA